MPTAPLPDLPITLPDPDTIRLAIDRVDEQARLLRRLLRLVLRLRTDTSRPAPAPADAERGQRGDVPDTLFTRS
jgi:hypothetical protein